MHLAQAGNGIFSFGENFTFSKTGKEIAEKANAVIKRIHDEIREKRLSVADIVEKREIDFDAALEEADSVYDENIGSSKAYSNVAAVLNNAAAKAMKEIQEDIRKVQEASRVIVRKRTQIAEMERLTRNIDPSQVFTLHWVDLVLLDF